MPQSVVGNPPFTVESEHLGEPADLDTGQNLVGCRVDALFFGEPIFRCGVELLQKFGKSHDVDQFVGNAEQYDDMTVVVAKKV